mmetsp:Transcript_32514/g.103671  ORF Transcript_32514/g.103671 Transcript_32514/m.103671 type:complete len:639 (-) Transcript_32514:24-1940(-)
MELSFDSIPEEVALSEVAPSTVAEDYENDFEEASRQYSTDFEEENDFEQDDFEEESSSPSSQEPPRVEAVLAKLTSQRALPVQIAELRRRAVEQDLEGLDKGLDQIAVDLVATERRHRREKVDGMAKKRAARRRADARRRDHERRLAEAERRARHAEGQLSKASRETRDATTRLLEVEGKLQEATFSIEDLRKEADRAAAVASEDKKQRERQQTTVLKLEADLVAVKREADLATAAWTAAERREAALLDRLPEVEKRRVEAEERRLDELRSRLEDDVAAFRKRTEQDEARLRLITKQQEADRERRVRLFAIEEEARRKALDKVAAEEQALLASRKQKLDALVASMHAQRALLERDRTRLDADLSSFRSDKAAFAAKVAALKPRFSDARDAETDARRKLEFADDTNRAADAKLAAANAKQADLDNAIRRANTLAADAADAEKKARAISAKCDVDLQHCAKRQADIDKARFYLARQQTAMALRGQSACLLLPSSTAPSDLSPPPHKKKCDKDDKENTNEHSSTKKQLLADQLPIDQPPRWPPRKVSDLSDENDEVPVWPVVPPPPEGDNEPAEEEERRKNHILRDRHDDATKTGGPAWLTRHVLARIRTSSTPYQPAAYSTAARYLAHHRAATPAAPRYY